MADADVCGTHAQSPSAMPLHRHRAPSRTRAPGTMRWRTVALLLTAVAAAPVAATAAVYNCTSASQCHGFRCSDALCVCGNEWYEPDCEQSYIDELGARWVGHRAVACASAARLTDRTHDSPAPPPPQLAHLSRHLGRGARRPGPDRRQHPAHVATGAWVAAPQLARVDGAGHLRRLRDAAGVGDARPLHHPQTRRERVA